jgi:hypothetical protein
MTNRLPRYRVRALHLTAVWAYGVSQPVFSLVSGNQEMLIAENASRLDAIFVVSVIALVPPLLAVGYAWLASRLSRWVGDIVYVFLLGAFLAPVVLQLEKHFEPSALLALSVTAVLSTLGVVFYLRFHAVRLFVGFSIVLPLVGLLMFARGLPPLTGEAHAAPPVTVASPHPVVVLLFDEFPVRSLMTPAGTIDDVRYPNFARLAREGNWFPNATTVHDSTQGASPAILTGRVKRNGNLPIAFNYPDNLFSLLGDEYALDVHEAATRLCPREYCVEYGEAGFLDRVKGVARAVRYPYVVRVMPESLVPAFREVDFDRVQGGKMSETLASFEALLSGVKSNEPNRVLHFAHVLVPHSPWRFFPSGVEYNFDERDGLVDRHLWPDEPWAALRAEQQHLLQVGYTDALLGRLIERLEEVGLYDRALLVVLADHGIAFKPGASQRWASPGNLLDISNVPLFVKYPEQRQGSVDRRHARVVDVVPTIADVLDVSIPWQVDGESLLSPPARRPRVEVTDRGGMVFGAALVDVKRRRDTLVRRQAALFGQGTDSMFRLGTNLDLLGTAAPEAVEAADAPRVKVENRAALSTVDLATRFVPANITGVVRDGPLGQETELAVAVNGVFRALTRPVEWQGREVFSALVPDTSFRQGANRVDVFAVETRGSIRRVVWLGSN